MHKYWCGKPCSDCASPCAYDSQTPCSLDCEAMMPNGERNIAMYIASGCDAMEDKQ